VSSNLNLTSFILSLHDPFSHRERREDKVFNSVLKLGIGLRERVLDASSNDEVELIADLVSAAMSELTCQHLTLSSCAFCSFKRGPMLLELMTQKE
jgi:hypothetical protein